MRTQAACFVQEGDQPITLKWEKDGLPLEPLPDVRVSQMDPFTSMLILEKVTDVHSGNYSCLASNAVRTASTTAKLTVRGTSLGVFMFMNYRFCFFLI
ncbi:UNVERIFIED_CONTAM: hypothetical protein GTU68_031908 [Idotea baltica]|nr:hypothetical protein [Idotea baltica]